ncbi:SDR family oxidoreductase [Hyphococcus sp.]|uniref:SDR family oxidoreductase n=1 Tax=Hyphococcus sp. TaxID=2038636 RepID=UPI003CCC1970
MGRVDGKVALVTGAASGLGLEDAKMLANEGARVVLTDISDEKGAAAAEEIGANAAFFKHDVSSEDDWKNIIAQVEKTHGQLDILVNNAGVVVLSSPEDCTLKEFKFANAVMSEGVFLGCKYALPLLRQGDGGSIINMSSTASHLGYPIFFAYSAAKGAVRSMTKSIAMHCQAEGYPVRCNSVHAGAIETPMVQFAQGRTGETPQEIPEKGVLPADSLGTPRDIANMILYLASDESRFVTGAEFVIDNGLVARPAG